MRCAAISCTARSNTTATQHGEKDFGAGSLGEGEPGLFESALVYDAPEANQALLGEGNSVRGEKTIPAWRRHR
jgi:hypothetical protein